MDDALFRAYPYHAQMDYAADREGDGIFDDTSLQAWKDAYIDWTVKYGQKRFTAAGIGVVFTMEGTRKDFEKMAREERLPPLPGKIEDPTTVALEIESLVKEKLNWQDRYHSTSNYKYWKLRCQAEQESEMRDVREKLFYGKRKFAKEAAPDEARPLLEAGHLGLQKMIEKFGLDEWGQSKLMENDEILLEDTLKSLLIYERVCEGLPAGDFPLKSVWDNPKYQKQREDLREKFIKKFGAG